MGSKVVHGIGGSGDFLRNAYLPIVHFPSTRSTAFDPTGMRYRRIVATFFFSHESEQLLLQVHPSW